MEKIIFILFLLGFVFPSPPGVIGCLIHWYFLGGKQEYIDDCKRWEKIDQIESDLKKEGKTISDEIKLARKGKSKYFKI